VGRARTRQTDLLRRLVASHLAGLTAHRHAICAHALRGDVEGEI